VRALGKEGIKVTIGESTRLATALFSRYCRHPIVYPSPLFQSGHFIEFLRNELIHRPHRMLLPMEDETMGLIARHHREFSRLTYLPVVPFETFEFARRKDNILKLAQQRGIPTPRTWYIDHVSDVDTLKNTLSYPVVIKPTTGAGANGVRYPENARELIRHYQEVHRYFPHPMIQEYIPREGPGYGASFLVDERGEIKASFVHKRLREYPITGGASTLRESTRYDTILAMGEDLLKAIGWFGVAMVEFKIDLRDGTPKLMELNPRFWGSLNLAVAAGVNFPYLLYRMARGEKFEPVVRYEIGKKSRWLLPGDILHFIDHPRRSTLLPDFFYFRQADTVYDICSLKDPLPVLARLATPFTFLYDQDMKYRLRKRKL